MHPESNAIEISCRKCRGTGTCQACGSNSERKKTCVQCYYSGRCAKCGGTRVEVISRSEAERLGYRR